MICFTLEANTSYIFSINEEYLKPAIGYRKGGFKGAGKPYPYMYKTPKAKEYCKDLTKQFKSQLKEYDLSKVKSLVVSFYWGLLTEVNSRDASNCVKLVEDSLKDALGIDDSKNFVCNSAKYPLEEEHHPKELITVIVNGYEI